MTTPNDQVNRLISDLHAVARSLDDEVHDRALDCGLTEHVADIAHLTPRQNLVRLMVRVTHELNSMLSDDWDRAIGSATQPSSYGPTDPRWGC